MSRAGLACATAAAVIAAAGGALSGGTGHLTHARDIVATLVSPAAAQSAEEPIYYQDPDGKPVYSPTPKTTADGRAFRAVPPSADLNFDDVEEAAAPAAPAPTPATASGERKIKFYRNPMGLPDTSPVPKKDPMGMNYIPVYEGEESDDGSVSLSPQKIQRTGVKSERAAMRLIRTTIRAPGAIQLDERRVSVIAMRSESFIQSVANVTTGSKVAKGEPLMQVYSPTVSSAAAEYVATINSKTVGGVATYGRGSRQRLVNLDVPEAAIVAIEKGGPVPTVLQWSAPRDGIVLERNVIEGARANPGDVLFRIADISQVWALVDVAERDLGALSVGQAVSVRARGYPGRVFEGRVSVIYPQVNRDTRTARLRIELPNPDMALLPEMYLDAEIDTGNPQPVLAVPDSAVLDSGERQVVLVQQGEGRFAPREVKLGHRGGGYVEVRQGVSDGEAVVVSANFLIDAESNLKAALKSFSDAGAMK
ncbi:efflux RND transporter periplasmic adaptor subunit [Rhodopseudomonas palustris]|uniref:Secretion protein HlyD n=1 Tax=Rhodopseudomonas palustris (strain BisB18) TaxID=316056 RepID=Q20XF6_RHOPB